MLHQLSSVVVPFPEVVVALAASGIAFTAVEIGTRPVAY